MRTQRKNVLVAAVAALGFTLAGCTGASDTNENAAPPSSSESNSESQPEATTKGGAQPAGIDADLATTQFAVSWQDAVDIAKAKFEGELTEIELDWNLDRWAYKVELVSASDEFEVRVDATTGETSNEDTDAIDANDLAQHQAMIFELDAVVTWDDALGAALAVQDGTVDEWTLEGTGQGPRYIFDVKDASGKDLEITIDAITGTLVSVDD